MELNSSRGDGENGEDCLSKRREPTPILDCSEAYGCKLNAIDPAELFTRYKQAGFLYPAKMTRLQPFMPLVLENWRRAIRGGELIHWIIAFEDPATASWGSVSSWRHTNAGWNTQHLVSIGGPTASRAVLLAGQAIRIRDGLDASLQNWFQPSNRFANKVFGSLVKSVGTENSWVGLYSYLAVPPSSCRAGGDEVTVHECRSEERCAVCELAEESRGHVYVQAEALGHEDVRLDGVDHLYRMVGLRRYRRVFLAEDSRSGQLLGAALAYRGPLGFNFSFLENRCDLVMRPFLSETAARSACSSLVQAAAAVYEDFPLRWIPVVTDQRTGVFLIQSGAEFIRQYAQSIWLSDGFVRWYRHVERFYDPLIRAGKLKRLGSWRGISRPHGPTIQEDLPLMHI